MMKTGRTTFVLMGLFFLFQTGMAQPFAWKAPLEKVPQNGFYRIPLSPDWLWRLKTDLSDVRIRNEQGQTVPFLLQQNRNTIDLSFVPFLILRHTIDTAITTLEVDAGAQAGTDRIDLVMNNTAVERSASLSGSDDGRQWFIIDENLRLTNAPGSRAGQFIQSLHFPFIHYRYLKLQIRNKGTDPLPVKEAGVFVDTAVRPLPEMYRISGTTFRQMDSSDGYTYIQVHHPLPYPVDRINMQLSGLKFFQREVQVYTPASEKKKEMLMVAEIRSGEEPSIWLPGIKAQELLITIKNGDNPPLNVTSLNTFTRQRQLIAYFEKEKQYEIVGGNAEVSLPQYDLTHFRDSIPSSLATLSHGAVIPSDNVQQATAGMERWWIWPAILVTLLFLTMLTVRMVGEVRRSEA